ncbi:MAG: hypothetical protein WD071_15880 [Pseudohongiella sp.]|uniref:hypothetical protein n=1 Tax=Pseudohongiella sp. TaxID=1979412 RepID=UPI0034A083F6
MQATFEIDGDPSVIAGELATVEWNSNGDICYATNQNWDPSGELTFTAAVGDSGNIIMECTNPHHFAQDDITLNVCDQATIDNYAVSTMQGWTQPNPYEEAITLVCNGANSMATIAHATSWSHWGGGKPTMDPCTVTMGWTSTAVSGAHSHPYFNNTAEYNDDNGCHGDTDPVSAFFLSNLNAANKNFGQLPPGVNGTDDFDFASNQGPLYLLTPTAAQVKVLPASHQPRLVWP